MRKTLSGSPLKGIGPMGLIGLMSLMSLMGCSNDSEDELQPMYPTDPTVEAVEVAEVKGYVIGYEEMMARTRAEGTWTLPSGYTVYSDTEKPISVFFTQTTGEPVGGYEEEFFFVSSGKWRVSKTDLAQADYYLYGYVPHEKYIDASVTAPSGEGKTFADGATLTLSNLPSVTQSDICVIIGATNGKDDYKDDTEYTISSLQRGDFKYAAETTGESSTGANRVYLLFDHIYSAVTFQMRVHGDYDALRHIRLKELRLQTSNNADQITKSKTDVAVELTKTDDGREPITSVTFTPAGDEEIDGAVYKAAEGELGELLTTSYKPHQSHFMPEGVKKLILTSVYDVYDTKGNLIREGCTAKNTLVLSNLFSLQESFLRGRRYIINLTIQPTYLYVLSEPDLLN